MSEYPADVMPLYAEGYSLAEYLIQHGGRRNHVQFLDNALESASGRRRSTGITARPTWGR